MVAVASLLFSSLEQASSLVIQLLPQVTTPGSERCSTFRAVLVPLTQQVLRGLEGHGEPWESRDVA